MKREERERRDWYIRFCMNIGGKFVPMKELCPNKEFYKEKR